ncbi:MAG: Na+/H+ antiporter NhaC family protein, partial [Gemmiger sp.]
MEWVVLALFCGVLLVCLGLGLPVLWALGVGLVLFGDYALRRGFSLREVRRMCWEGIREAKTVLLTFALIGILTALWRAAGTIPAIICYASALFVPSLFLTVTFVLTSLVSFLTGTAFGTAATMGVICATMASAMGISPVLAGGAILSGCYFGDRCSPVSTSALLVAEVTRTDLFSNIRGMLRTGAVPFALSCALYTAIGLVLPRGTV